MGRQSALLAARARFPPPRTMKVLRSPAALPPATAACIGAFDGLHRGHQALLRRAAELARRVALVTFDPHPAQVLLGPRAPALLQTPSQRERVCMSLGVDDLVLLPFTTTTAAMPPSEFVDAFLLEGLRPAAVVVGDDFRFGAGRAGDTAALARLVAPAGIPVDIVPVVRDDASGGKLGSSGIRAAVAAGEVESIWTALGRHYAVEGTVVHGAGRGRRLGIPTANVACPGALLPRPGVYAAALVVVDPGSPLHGRVWPATANLGTNPTFVADPGAPLSLEAHVLGVDLGDRLYDVQVEVAFLARLRDEMRFPGAAALRAQIDRDLAAAAHHHDAATMARVLPPPPLASREAK
ncbi:MAG TPA: riboflavin biosynthesis protein RibF [Nannocystaceae bacterium]|nr:riboflavin biosynthesis protein RibF [Nannocystaceae bacterium]